jgi:hypothetical protein
VREGREGREEEAPPCAGIDMHATQKPAKTHNNIIHHNIQLSYVVAIHSSSTGAA